MKIQELAKIIDSEILELVYQRAHLMSLLEIAVKAAERTNVTEMETRRREGQVTILQQRLVDAQNKINVLENVYDTYGWTRAYIVPGGHVHSDYHCHTLFPETERFLVAEVSGMTEDEIVAKAGERACTICYPSAPSNYLALKSELFTRDELAKEQARQEREHKRNAKEAAKVTFTTQEINPRTKQPYTKTHSYGTLRSAQNEIISHLWWAHRAYHHGEAGHAMEYYNECKPIARAMAAHPQEERTFEEIMKECDTKAEKNFKRDLRSEERKNR